jgi:hypothetical protein
MCCRGGWVSARHVCDCAGQDGAGGRGGVVAWWLGGLVAVSRVSFLSTMSLHADSEDLPMVRMWRECGCVGCWLIRRSPRGLVHE